MAPYFYKLPQWNWSKTVNAKKAYTSIPGGSPGFQDRTSIDHDSNDGLLEKGNREASVKYPQRPIWKDMRFLTAHCVLFAVYIFILFLVANDKGSARYYGMPYSPARDVLSYEETTFALEDHITETGAFSGKPNPAIDKAWHDLLNDENILIEPEYIKHYGKEDTAVEVPEGGRYLGTMNVYHEIHCLKRIRQYMYPDYYFPGISSHDMELNRKHNEHCIDFLRQSAMCHGDIGLITYSWRPENSMPVANATSHQCVNWEKFSQWTHARSVDMMKPGWLIHPTRGPAYPDGEGDKIGALEVSHHGHGGH